MFFSFLKEVPLQKMKFHFERDAFLYYVCLAIKLKTSPGQIIVYIIKISKYKQQCRNQHFSESRKKCSGSVYQKAATGNQLHRHCNRRVVQVGKTVSLS